jgi:hypothetical protein
MYQDAEKKIGEQSAEVHSVREKEKAIAEQEKNMQVLLNAIYADPKNVESATSWINRYLGVDQQAESTESGEGSGKSSLGESSDDTRKTLQNLILADFYKRHGLHQLSPDERKAEEAKLAGSFAELLDPGGKKPMRKLLNEVPLDRLDKYLEKAYRDVNYDKVMSDARMKGLLSAEENRQASIGSLSSSGAKGGSIALSPEEKQVADRLGISYEAYAKSKTPQ